MSKKIIDMIECGIEITLGNEKVCFINALNYGYVNEVINGLVFSVCLFFF